MSPLRLSAILTAVPTLVIGITVGCGGDTSQDRGDASQGGVSTGGAQASGGSGIVGDGGEPGGGSGGEASAAGGGGPSTGGQGGSAGSAGSISEGGSGGMEGPTLLFIILTLERGPGAGYCVQPGNILEAGIVYSETGDYWMSGTVFREWDESRPDACWGIHSPDCVISEQFELMLTAPQVAELAALLEVLPEDRCELDEMMECDPCLITTLVIDGTSRSDYCCGTQLSAGYDQAFQAVAGFLDGLVPEAG